MKFKTNYSVHVLDKWDSLERIDQSSTYEVFLVKEAQTRNSQVLKLFKPTVDPTFSQYEAQIALSISHPRVCMAIDFFPQLILPPSDDPIAAVLEIQPTVLSALVLEYVPNGDLVKLTKSLGYLPEMIARTYFLQLIDAIQCIHLAGICHLDIKPGNILLDENYCLKLADFGLALEVSARTLLKETAGTPPYFSPEMHQNLKYNGFQTDLFALGVTLFTMVVGSLPFGAAKLDDPLYKMIAEEDYGEFWKFHANSKKQGPQFYNRRFRDLIQRISAFKIERRLSIQIIREHEWVKGLSLSDVSVRDFIKYFMGRANQVKSTSYAVKKENNEEMVAQGDCVLSSK